MAKRDKIIRELLTEGFSRDELKILASDLGANPENIFSESATLPVTARELLAWCYRRNKVKELLDEINLKHINTIRNNYNSQNMKTPNWEMNEGMKTL